MIDIAENHHHLFNELIDVHEESVKQEHLLQLQQQQHNESGLKYYDDAVALEQEEVQYIISRELLKQEEVCSGSAER